ncbi:MAG: cytidine deaminase [Thermoflavifilum sp.]|nr:cytidine deaminase [Thermoflavifilum sp.]
MPEFTLAYERYTNDDALTPADRHLLQKARETTRKAYAPYSFFQVGAAILLQNGQVICGANQENASFPAGICAERVALSAASALYPGIIIQALAVSYLPVSKETGMPLSEKANHPISPCGICRQSLLEYEQRQDHPIRIILGGMRGEIIVIPTATSLLPFSFSAKDLAAE